MTLLEKSGLKIELKGFPEPVQTANTKNLSVFIQKCETDCIAETLLSIEGDAHIFWPNREGEQFSLYTAHEKLKALNRQNSGISLCWPATASLPGVAVLDDPWLYTFIADNDADGKARFLELKSEKHSSVSFKFTGSPASWQFKKNRTDGPSASTSMKINSFYQIGLIGPDGESAVPEEQGFSVLLDAADIIEKVCGKPNPGDVIHIFGYAEGHDRGYPDYSPSRKLGGSRALKDTLAKLTDRGYETSLYMNARLAEINKLQNFPELRNSVLQNENGPLVEEYHGRKFAVMNPGSEAWKNHLRNEVLRLKKTGVNWIQLDQVAGRAALVKPGEPWGSGYLNLIEQIQDYGLKVWIQGLSNYYPADAFEATWREVSILDDGTLRGGWPLGKPDTTLIKSTGFTGTVIVPLNKITAFGESGLPLLLDRSTRDGNLPLWGKTWADNLIKGNYSRLTGEFNGGIQ